MATGRTKHKWWKVYVGGYDLSGYSRTIGPLELTYDEADLTAHMSDTVKGYLPNTAQVNVGSLNAVFDNTATSGIHALMKTSGVAKYVCVALGIRATPADGDPCFGGMFYDSGYQVVADGGAVTVNIPFAGWASNADTMIYANPWGTLLHANAAATDVNSAAGFYNPTGGATANGGYMVYHCLASSGAGYTHIESTGCSR